MADDKKSFSMFGDDLLISYDDKFLAFLSKVASLTSKDGYCKANNQWFKDHMFKMSKSKVSNRLDYLENHGLIVRYFKITKDDNKNNKSKRLIVLTDRTYNSYHAINSNVHAPIKKPNGYLTTGEYNDLVNSDRKTRASSEQQSLKEKYSAEKKNVASDATEQSSKPHLLIESKVMPKMDDTTTLNNSDVDVKKDVVSSSINRFDMNNVKKASNENNRIVVFKRLLNAYKDNGFSDNDAIDKATRKVKEMGL